MTQQYPFRNFYHIVATNAKTPQAKLSFYDGDLK